MNLILTKDIFSVSFGKEEYSPKIPNDLINNILMQYYQIIFPKIMKRSDGKLKKTVKSTAYKKSCNCFLWHIKFFTSIKNCSMKKCSDMKFLMRSWKNNKIEGNWNSANQNMSQTTGIWKVTRKEHSKSLWSTFTWIHSM